MKKSAKNFLKNLTVQTEHQSQAAKTPALAVDYGEKFCGLAWSPDGAVVLPLKVVPHIQIVSAIKTELAAKNLSLVILGLPLSSDDQENHICAQIRQLGQTLTQANLQVEYVNERFSTQNVLTATNKRKDDLAAAQILEFWLQQK